MQHPRFTTSKAAALETVFLLFLITPFSWGEGGLFIEQNCQKVRDLAAGRGGEEGCVF